MSTIIMSCRANCEENQQTLEYPTCNVVLCFGSLIWGAVIIGLAKFSVQLLYRTIKKINRYRSKKLYFIVWINFYVIILGLGALINKDFFVNFQEFIMNLTFTGLLYFFAIKHVKLQGGFKDRNQKIIFFSSAFVYVLFLFGSFLYELSVTNICERNYGVLVMIGGSIPAVLLVILGFKQAKKMRQITDKIVMDDPSVSMDYIVSKESQIDHLWELIVVYAIAKFMDLMSVIYFLLDPDQGIGIDVCYYIPKDKLKKDQNLFLLEILIELSIKIISIVLPIAYTIRLFWVKPLVKKDTVVNGVQFQDEDYNNPIGQINQSKNNSYRPLNGNNSSYNNNQDSSNTVVSRHTSSHLVSSIDQQFNRLN